MLPFKLSDSKYAYFADNQLRVEIKEGIETGIKIETQKQQQQRAIQVYTLYEIAAEISQRPVKSSDKVQKDVNENAEKPWLLLNSDNEIEQRFKSRDEATLTWVSQVASSLGRISELGYQYSSRFKQMLLEAPVSEEMDAEMVAIFLRFRGEFKDDGGRWRSLNRWCQKEYGCDWGIEQVRQMPAELTEEIYKVVIAEQSAESTEEDDTNLPLEREKGGSKDTSTTPSTGNKSTGESNSAPSEGMSDSTTTTSLTSVGES